jgi:hypothetical protein
MSVWTGRWFSYFAALVFITILGVYLLDIPTILSGAPDLVQEYYYDNAVSSFVLDVFIVAAYIAVAMYVAGIMKVKNDDHATQVVVLALVSVAISGLFMKIFQNGYKRGSFFSRWFKRVGYRAVLYDVGLVCSVYLVMISIHNRVFS